MTLDKSAVLTAVSPNLWYDFKLFLYSLRTNCDCNLYVVNIGLSADQCDFIKRQNVKIIDFEYNHHQQSCWPKFAKPYYFDLIPDSIDLVLWIDVDTIILKPLQPLFAKAAEKFFVISDYFAPKSCINDDELYRIHKIEIKKQNQTLSLNSGVIGWSRRRSEDVEIISEWQRLTNLVNENQHLLQFIKLYDQGILLWAIHKLNKAEHVLNIKEWNYPAKRNPYNISENSYRWLLSDGMIGGDVFDNIKYDNHNAVIAHYAGSPKLSNLLKIDNNITISNIRNKYGNVVQRRIFVVGLERAGTHTLAESVRRSSKVECWVRHEYSEINLGRLAVEAYKKFHCETHRLDNLYRRIILYSRNDCVIICESNHRLAFFIPEIHKGLNGDCKFVLLLRDPVAIIRSRLYNFSIWPHLLTKYPYQYQYDVKKKNNYRFNAHKSEFNRFRITPPGSLDIIDMYIWEICTILEMIFSDAAKSKANLTILWLEQLQSSAEVVNELFGHHLDNNILKHHLGFKYGTSHLLCGVETSLWIESLISENSERIYKSVYATLIRHNCQIPAML